MLQHFWHSRKVHPRLVHQQSSISTHNLPRTPSSIRRAQHPHDPSHLIRIRRSSTTRLGILHHLVSIHAFSHLHKRRVLDPSLDPGLELSRVGRVHGTLHGARVDCVDRRPLAELARPHARHGLQRGFGPTVDGLAYEAALRRDGRQVDHAAGAIRWEVRRHGLHEQQRAEDVDFEGEVEVFGVDFGKLAVLGDTGVVDDDIDSEFGVGTWGRGVEVVLGGGDEGGGALDGAQIGLDTKGLDAILGLKSFG